MFGSAPNRTFSLARSSKLGSEPSHTCARLGVISSVRSNKLGLEKEVGLGARLVAISSARSRAIHLARVGAIGSARSYKLGRNRAIHLARLGFMHSETSQQSDDSY